MAGEINSIPAGKMPSTIDQTANFAKGLGLSDKATETIKDIAALLGGRNVSVNTNQRADGAETGRPTGSTGVPALDNPADIKQLEQNLEKLLSYIQMDNEERQTAAAESRKASKIFGWLMTALAVVAAVVACVATGGLAVGPVIGAAIAIGCQVLNETGVMDKIVEKLAKGLEGMGLSKQASQILAQVLITVAIMAASLGAGLAGGGASAVSSVAKGVADTVKGVKVTVETMEKIRAAVALTMTIVGIGSGVASGVGAYDAFKAGMSQADVSETEKYITALKQRLDECEEELNQILQMLQQAISQVAEMLSSATDTQTAIANNMGAMA